MWEDNVGSILPRELGCDMERDANCVTPNPYVVA
jgi:hypothetical protein